MAPPMTGFPSPSITAAELNPHICDTTGEYLAPSPATVPALRMWRNTLSIPATGSSPPCFTNLSHGLN